MSNQHNQVRVNPNAEVNPHMFQVCDRSMPVLSAQRVIGEFHSYAAAKDYALQISQMNGGLYNITKGEYVR